MFFLPDRAYGYMKTIKKQRRGPPKGTATRRNKRGKAQKANYKLIVSAIFFLVLSVIIYTRQQAPQIHDGRIQVYFSPRGGATDAIVNALDNAKEYVLVQAYSFTSPPIAEAVRDAHRRGLSVRVILDKSQRSERYTVATFLSRAGVPVWIDDRHAIAHDKVIVIDENTVITGSFNFSRAAEERNAENLLIIESPSLAKRYIQNWQAHQDHSVRFLAE